MSTPRQHGEDPKPRLKHMGELQYESIIWEGKEAKMVYTTEPGEGNAHRAAFILLNKENSRITEYQEVTNQNEKFNIGLIDNERSFILHDPILRSYQTPDTPGRSQEGHQSGHDLDTGSHLEDKSPVLKDQPIKRQTITSQASRKSRPRFVTTSKKMRAKPAEMKVKPSRRQFLATIRDARHMYAEFKESKRIRAVRLQQAENWAEDVPKQDFYTTSYPIQFLLPFITGKLSIPTIACFNTYFTASRTLLLVPTPVGLFNSQQIKDLEKQMEMKFELDSVKLECSRPGCTRRSLCYGARAIKERGGSSYGLWQCYEPKKGEATERTDLAQSYNEAKPIPAENIKTTIPKQKVKVSPSFTSRQGNHLNINTNPRKRMYTKWEERTMKNQAINVKINVSYAHQPHGSNGNKCKCLI